MRYHNQPELGIKGFSNSGGTVIINVDCSGYTGNSINMPKSSSYINGAWLVSCTPNTFTNGRVLWNFGSYSGSIQTKELYGASILAPYATVTNGATLNGTIIAKNVNIDNESHRDDFVGKLPFTVSKNWVGIDKDALKKLSVKVELYANGVSTGQTQILTAPSWTYTWSDLDKSKTYTVKEIGVYLNGDTTNNLLSQYTSSSVSSGSGCTITNIKTSSYELPETGGPGTYPFTVGGLGLILTSSLLLWRRKRRREACS